MERTKKTERQENCRNFFAIFNGYETNKAVIVVKRMGARCQFLAVPSMAVDTPVVIAESRALGIVGCWQELLEALGKEKKSYYDDHFKEWINKTCGFNITYFDGLAFIIER